MTAAALDGLNAAAVALMAGVTWVLARDAVVDVPTALLAVGSLAVLLRWKVNPVWLMAAGAAVGSSSSESGPPSRRQSKLRHA